MGELASSIASPRTEYRRTFVCCLHAQNKPLVSKVVLLHVAGIDSEMLNEHKVCNSVPRFFPIQDKENMHSHLLDLYFSQTLLKSGSYDRADDPQSALEGLEECLGPPIITLALGSTVLPANTVTGLLTVEVPKTKGQNPKPAEPAAEDCPTPGPPASDNPPPFPPSYYVLSPAEMADNNYPLPGIDEKGQVIPPVNIYALTSAQVRSPDTVGFGLKAP